MNIFDTESIIYTNRGSAGLWAILKALEKPGLEVIIPSAICEIVPAGAIYAGMKPVFCDVSPESGNMTLDHIKNACTQRTAAIVAAHTYGFPLDITDIQNWALDHGIFLIEDVCNAFGARSDGKAIGGFGDAAFFSFGYAKIIEVGCGGALFVRDQILNQKAGQILTDLPGKTVCHKVAEDALEKNISAIRKSADESHDTIKDLYHRYIPDLFYRPDASLIEGIRGKIKHYQDVINQRQQSAMLYRKFLDHPAIKHLPDNREAVYWRYNVLVAAAKRDLILKLLRDNGLHASTWYPPVHHLFCDSLKPSDLAGAWEFGQRVINLWVNEDVSDDDIRKTGRLITRFLNGCRE